MRAAPAVGVLCTGGWPWQLLQTGLPALAAGAFAAWLLGHAALPLAPALAVGLLTGLGLVRRRRGPALRLQWDGQGWRLDGQAGRMQLMVDLGALLLLRMHPEHGRRRWLAVTAAEASTAWHGLRAALYSRASVAASAATARVLSPERPAD